MRLTGQATPAGTKRFAQRHSSLHFNGFAAEKFAVSQLGFGTFRLQLNQGAHEQALRFALQQGINLIDTSTAYAQGEAERVVGAVLQELIEDGEIQRDELVVISQAGYVQGFDYAYADKRKREGRPFPNTVKYAEAFDYCIHPEFLEDQFDRSRDRLNLATIDGYLLQNPEHYLRWAQRAHIPLAEARHTFYERIRLAFSYLEEMVHHGDIQWYGLSSNTLSATAGDHSFISLARLWQVAQTVAPDHHFRLVQTPANVLEPGALLNPSQSDGKTALNFARRHGLQFMASRALTARREDVATHLVDVDMPSYPAPAEDVSTAVDTLKQHEADLANDILPQLSLDDESEGILRDYFGIGDMLDGRWGTFGSYYDWQAFRTRFLLKRAQTAIDALSNVENLPAEAVSWLDAYAEAANIALAAISAYFQERSARESAHLKRLLAELEPNWAAPRLSQSAVRALRATQGITAVLVGMRHQHYVTDLLQELKRPVVKADYTATWQQLQQQLDQK